MKYLCAACDTKTDFKKPIILSSDMKPEWLQENNYVYNFIEKKNKNIVKMENYEQCVDIHLKNKNNCYLLYWASKPTTNELIIQDAKTAYGNFANYGICRLNDNGDGKLYIKTPQNYHTIRKNKNVRESFYRHIHFVLWNDEGWDKKNIYTQVLYCNINSNILKKHMRKHDSVLLNTLPAKYYAKEHIPNSYNLHYLDVKKMKMVELEKWMTDVVYYNYKTLIPFLNSYSIFEIPIILYCAHKDCNASHLCAIELYKKGFVNVRLYKGGMKMYYKDF